MHTIIRKYLFLLGAACLFMGTIGCNPAFHLEKDEYLLQRSVKVKGNKSLSNSTIRSAIKSKPNRKFVASKLYLFSYNFGTTLEQDSSLIKRVMLKNPNRKQSFDKLVSFFKDKVGEPPVLVDLEEIKRDSTNLRNAYFANGYFYPDIRYEIDTLSIKTYRHKANVRFHVEENRPYVIGAINDSIETIEIRWLYEAAWNKKLLKVGDNYSHLQINKERQRISALMRDNGYFSFAQKLVSFSVDTFWNAKEAEIQIKNADAKALKLTVHIDGAPIRYRVGEINVKIVGSGSRDDENATAFRGDNYDILLLNSLGIRASAVDESHPLNFSVANEIAKKISFNFIGRRVHLKEGAFYSQKDARLTQRRLQELGMLQFVVMNYDVKDSTGLVDVNILLRLAPQYQAKFGAEIFSDVSQNSINLPSVGMNFAFRNKNTFKRSELLQLSVSGIVGFYTTNQDTSNQLYNEEYAQADINFPRFLLPFRLKRQYSGSYPTTTFSGSFRREDREEYVRTSTGLNLAYKWYHIPFKKQEFSQLSPLGVDFIFVPRIDSAFEQILISQPEAIQREYESRFSSGIRWIYTNSLYMTTREHPTHYVRTSTEIGGNLPWLLDVASTNLGNGNPEDNSTSDNLLWNSLFYGQYVKGSVEGKYYLPLWRNGELVLRGIIGGVVGYNNTNIVPPEGRFYSGGTNSMRGWQSNTLGPGRLNLDSLNSSVANLLAPGGEYKLELNAELRFDVVSYLELALFSDVGNVWFGNDQETRDEIGEKAVLSRKNLTLGWDAGIGFRFDFSFLILRLDIGQQLHSPSEGWVRNINLFGGPNTQLNLGIGYPF